MKVVTWSRESHGLFDYESKNINVKKCKVDNPCKIYRSSLFIFYIFYRWKWSWDRRLLWELDDKGLKYLLFDFCNLW